MNHEQPLIDNNEISFKEIITQIKNWIIYLKSKWWKIIIAGILGGILGFGYAFYQPITYTAKLSFIVEDSKNSSGGLASLAGLAGFDISGMTSGNGLLSGDNILVFLKSNSLVKSTLLTSYDSVKNYSLADKYAEIYKLKKQWKNSSKIGIDVFFPVRQNKPYTRLQDSLIQLISDKIIKKELSAERPEKKATFINVQTTMRDEALSKWFCERLVREATERYVYSKTKRQKVNVDKLQNRADSLGQLLNTKTFSSAIENEKILDVNPAYRSSTVNAEVVGRDKVMIGTIYGEVVKNLEIAKMQLSQETPTIYMVDGSELPAIVNKTSKIIFGCFGIVSISFIYIIYILFKRK